MRKVLHKQFFDRPTLVVAEELLGKYIVCKKGTKEVAYQIVEVEGYDGHKDKASHAHKGKTARTEVMFGEPGVWYVYLIYGMYDMLNIVTGPKKYPAAVLVRGVAGINGPGRLTKALGVTRRKFNHKRADKVSGLWIEDRGEQISKKHIQRLPRVGVAYAGEHWANKPYRFVYAPHRGQ